MRFTGNFILVFGLLLAVLCLLGCATIVRGTSQDIPIQSHPAHARVFVDGVDMGITPTVLNLTRSKPHSIRLSLAGHEDVMINLDRKFKLGASVVGNIFSFGIVGLVVDVANGSAYQLTPDTVTRGMAEHGLVQGEIGQDRIQVVLLTPDSAN